jgi:hypothetical protein
MVLDALQTAGEAASEQLRAEMPAGGLAAKLLFTHAAVSWPWPLWLRREAAALNECFDKGLGIKCWLPAAAGAEAAGPAAASGAAAGTVPSAAAALADAAAVSNAAAAGPAMSGAWRTVLYAEKACQAFLTWQWRRWVPEPLQAALPADSESERIQDLAGWVKSGWFCKLFEQLQ